MEKIKFHRFDVINFLITEFNYKSYLEIGVQYGVTWNEVKCEKKVGVEPIHSHDDSRILKLYSNDFFVKNKQTFDVIFIDGDHEYKQVIVDIRNAKNALNPSGCIVMHDCRPLTEEYGTNPYLNGTVWKAICEIRSENGWSICTLNDDHGVGVLRDGTMAPLNISSSISYREFENNRESILNLKNEKDFKLFFKKNDF